MPCPYIHLVLFAVSILLSTVPTQAQRLPFFNLSIESGLIQSQATCLAQDKLGRLWIGTLGGLSCYDGTTFTNYSARDGLPSGTITCLAAHPDGSVWVGTTQGLVKRTGQHFHPVPLPAPPVRLAIEDSGRVWCLAGGRLYRTDRARAEDVGLDGVTAILADPDNRVDLWVELADGREYVVRDGKLLDFGDNNPRRLEGSFPVSRMFLTHKGGRMMLGPRGVAAVSSHGWISWIHNLRYETDGTYGPYGKMQVTCGTQAPDGSLWLGTRSGVLHVTDSGVRLLRRRDGLSDNLFYDALTDKEGHVWLASDGQGLFRYSGAPFETLDESSGLPSAQVMAIAASTKGTLFFGTYDAGLFSYARGNAAPVSFPDGEVPSITSLAMAPDGTLWIGTRGSGLWKLNGGRLMRAVIEGGPLPQGSVTVLYIHPQTGELYAGLANKAAVLRGGRFHTLPGAGVAVQDMLALGPDSLLLATVAGLKLLHGGVVTKFSTGGPADSAVPQCVLGQGPELWIGTSDKGVLCYNFNTGRTLTIDRKAGLRSDFVYNLVADRTGAVWAGTGNGIHRIRRGGAGRPEVQYFGKFYGISGMESNQKASLMMPDGSLWFGTTAGAVHYRPGAGGQGVNAQTVHRRPVSLVMQSVLVSGTGVLDSSLYKGRDPFYGVPQGLRIPYRKNSMTVRFHAVSLGGPEEVLYRYRMEEKETPWSAWSPENTVTFSALPPGRHTLLVECGVDGKTAAQTLRYPFEVITPFHRTWVFYLLVLAGCVLLGVALQSLAARRRRAHEQELEALRREEQAIVRQRTAEDFHDEVGNTITRMTVLTSVLQSKVKDADAVRIIEQIRENAGRLYSGTRDILWSLKPGSDNLYEILHRIRDFGQDLFGDTDVRFAFNGSDERWQAHRLTLDWSRNLTMIFKEALNNTLKYAGASRVELIADLADDGRLLICLRDDGKGFDTSGVKAGHGLQNMKTRAARLGGVLEIESAPGAGTELTLRFKIPQTAA